MSSSSPPRRVYHFGVFKVDLAKRELLRQDVAVRLQEQPFRVLCLLLERPGETVTREALRLALWPSDTYVDFEGCLNAALKRLRFALRDSARNPTFIETLPKHGYRFIAPVSVEDLAAGFPPPLASTAINLPVIAPKPRRRTAISIAFASAILLQQAVYWLIPLPPPRLISRTRLTHVGNVEPGPIVTDGTRIFFGARRGGKIYSMQTSITGGNAVEVETPFKNSTIFDISPDRTSVLLGSSERMRDPMKLWIWPVQGGTPHPFGDVVCSDAAWSPDGRHVAYTSDGKLYLAKADGSETRLLANQEAYRLVWSPDRRKIRFTSFDPILQVHSQWEIRADGSHLQKIFPGNEKASDTSSGFWLAGGKYFAFLRGSFPHVKLWMTREWPSLWRRSSSRPFLVSTGAEDTETVARLGQNESRILPVGYWPDQSLKRLAPDSHSLTSVSLFNAATGLHFSRDGKWAVFSSNPDGELWRCRANGTDCLQLTPAQMVALEPRWSPDGSQVLFVDIERGVLRHLYVVSAQAISPPRALGPPNLSAGTADWSSDGTAVVVDMSGASSNVPGQLYLVNVKTGKSTPLPGPRGMYFPAWSRDGRRIAAITSDSDHILFYDVKQRIWARGPDGTRLGYLCWSYRSNNLFYQDLGEPNQNIYLYNLATRTKDLVFSFEETFKKDAITCRLSGIAPDDALYAYTIGAKVDLFLVDLDLP